jgi:hypothetical protein
VEQQDQCKKAAERGRRRHPADPLSIFPLCTKCHPAAVGFLALRQLLLLLFFFFFFFFFLHRGAFALDKLAHNHLLPSFTFFPFLDPAGGCCLEFSRSGLLLCLLIVIFLRRSAIFYTYLYWVLLDALYTPSQAHNASTPSNSTTVLVMGTISNAARGRSSYLSIM